MASTYSKDLEVFTAEQFKQGISTSNTYLVFGYQIPWSNELNPPQANTTVAAYYDTWKWMIGGKKISGSDIRHVIPRFNWTSGQTYIAYDQNQGSLTKGANTAYYVITDDYNVYKCIANNYGSASTYKPSSTNPGIVFQTADQYYWKYMYTLTVDEQQRFMTNNFIPVKTLMVDDSSLQWQVQDSAVFGAIDSILVLNKGEGYLYQNAVSVTITGDGRFANAYAFVDTSTEQITKVIVDNYGSGYTWANVTISSTVGKYATARAVISPPGGHGSDPLRELGGSYIMINTKLSGSEGGVLATHNDYRQISILQEPVVYASSNVMTNSAFSQLTSITLSSGGSTVDYLKDELVFQGNTSTNATFSGYVVEWDSANSVLKLNNTQGNPTSSLITGKVSAASKYLSSISYPDCRPYSGYMLYKDNITVIDRAEDQNEDFKIVLSF